MQGNPLRFVTALLSIVLACLSFSSSASAERATVYLHNGGQATGEIVVHLPNERITLDLGNGERVTFAAGEVAEVRKEAAPAQIAPPIGPAPAANAAASRSLLTPDKPPADPMNAFGLSLKLGLRGTVNTQNGVIVEMERTPEFNVGIGLNFGGDGFGWSLEPGLSVGKAHFKYVELDPRTPDATLVSLALYTGPTYYLHLTRTFYLGLGAGLRGSYGFWQKGIAKANPVEVAARIPINATFYLSTHIALVLEVAVGGGRSWWITDYLGGDDKSNVFIADFGAGVRLP